MDNHHPPISSLSTATTTTIPNSLESNLNANYIASHTNFQYYPLMPQQPPPFIGHAWFGSPNGDGYLHRPNMFIEQEKRALNAHRTKLARINRKIARQKSLSKKNPSPPSSSEARRHVVSDCDRVNNIQSRNNSVPNPNMDLYIYSTPANKRLRLLLKKELKNSDVGGLGRIVLPKREAELNLPTLSDKEGIYIVIRDIFSSQQWKMKFKFWCNNKSRMYVLENTGDFVRQNKMEMGDNLHLYEDESKNLYFAVEKNGRAAGILPDHGQTSQVPVSQVKDEEEAASLSLLIEQLKHSAQEETYSLMPFSVTSFASNNQTSTDSMEIQSVRGKARAIDDDNCEVDCCLGFSMVTDVNSTYTFSP